MSTGLYSTVMRMACYVQTHTVVVNVNIYVPTKRMGQNSTVRVATKRATYCMQYKVSFTSATCNNAEYAYLEEAEADGAKTSLVHARGLHHDAVSQSIHQTATHLGPDAQDELVLRHLPKVTPSNSTLTITSFTPVVRYNPKYEKASNNKKQLLLHYNQVHEDAFYHTAFVGRTSAAFGKYAWWIIARSLSVSARCWNTRRDACTRLTPSGTLSRPMIGFGDRLDNPDRSSVPCGNIRT